MKNTASQFMDKQIMDLSNPRTAADDGEGSFIDFLSSPSKKNGDILSSYDFMPIKQATGSTSTAVAVSSDVDAGDVDSSRRIWNSFDSKSDVPSIRNYDALDVDETAKFNLPKSNNSGVPWNVSLVSEVDKIFKKYMDGLTHSVDTMSARLSQLETRTRNLENSIDDMKGSVQNNHGSTDGRMRLLENILDQVRTSVEFVKDKQEIMEAQLQIAKFQVPPIEKDGSSNSVLADPTQRASGNQQFSSFSPAPPPQPLPPPPPHQNLQVPFQPPAPDPYLPPSNLAPEKPPQQYQVSAPQPQMQPSQLPHQQQHQSPSPQLRYPPQPLPSQPPPALPSQIPSSLPAANPTMLTPPPYGQHPEEASYAPPHTYRPSLYPPSSQPPTGLPHPQQSYGPGPTPNTYFPSPGRGGPGFSGPYGPPGATGEPYPIPYNNPQAPYGSSSQMNPHQHPSTNPQLPTARILPEALPAATAVGGLSSGSGGSPTDDVVDRVTAMGFPRDQVRATVRKLSEDGHAIDLNIVLDKLMNGGEGQAQRGWFGR